MKRRKRRIQRFRMPEISLTPLIDTALTLLVIFMVAAPMMQHSIKVNLPKGNSKDAAQLSNDIAVTVTKESVLFVDNEEVKKEALIEVLTKKVKDNPERVIYLSGDEQASFGKIMEVFDTLKMASITSVVLMLRS